MATYSGVKKIKIGDDIFVLDIPTATDIGIKFNYTTSGNNRAVQQDSNGNLYVTQKDDNTWTAMVGATSSANGSVGYVNATPPKDGYNTKFLRADGSWAIPNYTTNTDEKLKTVALTSATTYYPILATGANAAVNRQVDSTLGGLKYISTAGTTSAVGTALLQLGNAIASGTANNEQGVIRLYGTTAYYMDIKAESGLPAANRTIYLPSYAGTMYLTCTSTTNSVGGATTAPVYVKDTGEIAVVTSIPYSLLSGTPTIPTIPSNNITGSGTNGKVVKFTGTYTIGDGWGVTDNTTATAVSTSDTNLITGRTLANAGYVKSSGVTSITPGNCLINGTSGTSQTAITSTGTISHSTSGVGSAVTTAGFYKFKYDTYGHVTGVTAVAKADITGLGIPSSNTDTKVAQSASTTSNWKKLLLHYKDDAASTTAVTTSTEQVYAAVGISAQPSTGIVRTNGYNMSDKAQMVYDSTLDAIVFTFL